MQTLLIIHNHMSDLQLMNTEMLFLHTAGVADARCTIFFFFFTIFLFMFEYTLMWSRKEAPSWSKWLKPKTYDFISYTIKYKLLRKILSTLDKATSCFHQNWFIFIISNLLNISCSFILPIDLLFIHPFIWSAYFNIYQLYKVNTY